MPGQNPLDKKFRGTARPLGFRKLRGTHEGQAKPKHGSPASCRPWPRRAAGRLVEGCIPPHTIILHHPQPSFCFHRRCIGMALYLLFQKSCPFYDFSL
ncbi:hypothetical protein E2C01_015293 [Portunus trituberculatus]|uniref:Uncharacterized protein n=1 Tax=Portunus trituberculatus TaxID=210409 RepID=A0A5B7DKZ4_PORTR|nr:hypothetical protein [Portunus trituberculatus]